MNNIFYMKRMILSALGAVMTVAGMAQSVKVYTTTEKAEWKESKTTLVGKTDLKVVVDVNSNERGVPFRAWGTTFNELDWDAFNLLSRNDQDELMHRLFSADGDLHFTHGRVSMNANDYAREWYSCDDVVGDARHGRHLLCPDRVPEPRDRARKAQPHPHLA